MLVVLLGFIALTSLAFGVPFLMGGSSRVGAVQRGITFASIAAFVYVIAVLVLRS